VSDKRTYSKALSCPANYAVYSFDGKGTASCRKAWYTPAESDYLYVKSTGLKKNYLSRWTGSALTSSSIYDDGKVGIGTATPKAKLHIARADKAWDGLLDADSITIAGTSNTNKRLQLAYDPVNNLGYLSAGEVGKGWHNLILQYGGGSVGIGLNNPANAKLVVAGRINADTIGVRNVVGSFAGSGGANSWVGLHDGTAWDLVAVTAGTNKGNIGIGTTAPKAVLHVYRPGSGAVIRLERKNRGGWGILNIDNVMGQKDGADMVYSPFPDPNGTPKLKGGGHAFMYHNGTTDDVAMGIDRHGNVGIGTSQPTNKLDIRGGNIVVKNNGSSQILLQENGYGQRVLRSSKGQLYFIYDAGLETPHMVLNNSGNLGIGTTNPGSFKLYVNGSAYSSGSWSGSDRRWKKKIAPLSCSLDKVTRLEGVSYQWKRREYPKRGFGQGKQIGLIAQDVEKVVPEIVRTDHEGYKTISYEKLTPLLIEAIKEQNAAIKQQHETIKRQEQRYASLLERVAALEARTQGGRQ